MIRLEYSKTKPRTISIPLSTKHVNNWLDVHPAKTNPQAQLFPIEYDNIRAIISRIGKRGLNKQITPHMLRQSSATFYANKIKNPYKLCYRYGWAMSSDQVNRYLDREGIFEEETPEIVRSDDMSVVNKENSVLKEEISFVKESYSELESKFTVLKKELDSLLQGNNFIQILLTLSDKQKELSEKLSKLSSDNISFILPSNKVGRKGE